MITSRLMNKSRTTIPFEIRQALGLREGDKIAYIIENDRVILQKSEINLSENCIATFSEWASDADKESYAGL